MIVTFAFGCENNTNHHVNANSNKMTKSGCVSMKLRNGQINMLHAVHDAMQGL